MIGKLEVNIKKPRSIICNESMKSEGGGGLVECHSTNRHLRLVSQAETLYTMIMASLFFIMITTTV